MLTISRALVLAAAAAASLSPAAPDTRTLHAGEDVSAELDEIRAEKGAPALVAMAIQDGEVLAWGASGVRAAGSDDKVTVDDPFHLGSCTKAMSSTLVAVLIEEEVLSWDTRVADALPDLAKEIDPGFHDVTVEQLLRHRAGIAERSRPEVMAIYAQFETLEGTPREQRRAAIRLAMEKPPHTEPGTAYDYSNYGYMTAAAMIERLTDRSWEELIVEKVFQPLDMESAGIGSPTGDDVPVGHNMGGTPLPPGPEGILHQSMSPAGLAHCNLADWGKFVSDHVAGARGEKGLLEPATYQRLHRDPEKSGYACGWGIEERNWGWGSGSGIGHNGSDGTWYSVVTALPEWDLIVLVFSNCAGAAGPAAANAARDLMLELAGFAE